MGEGGETAGLNGFFQNLEYGRPILGVKIPFSWIDPAWKEGTIEIAEASLRPGGSGLWKLAVEPDLDLKGVRIQGPKEKVGPALQALNPKGIYYIKITGFVYQKGPKEKFLHLQNVTITAQKVTVTIPSGQKFDKKLIIEIFGEKVEFIDFTA